MVPMDPSVHDILLPGGSVTVEGIWQQHSIALLCQGICDAHQAPCIPRCCWALYHEGQWVFIIGDMMELWISSDGIYHDISQNMMWMRVKMGHADPPNGYIRRNDDQLINHHILGSPIYPIFRQTRRLGNTAIRNWLCFNRNCVTHQGSNTQLQRCFKSPYNCCWKHCYHETISTSVCMLADKTVVLSLTSIWLKKLQWKIPHF